MTFKGQKRSFKKLENSEKLEPFQLLNSERWEPKQKAFGEIGAQYFRKDRNLGFGEIEAPPKGGLYGFPSGSLEKTVHGKSMLYNCAS